MIIMGTTPVMITLILIKYYGFIAPYCLTHINNITFSSQRNESNEKVEKVYMLTHAFNDNCLTNHPLIARNCVRVRKLASYCVTLTDNLLHFRTNVMNLISETIKYICHLLIALLSKTEQYPQTN